MTLRTLIAGTVEGSIVRIKGHKRAWVVLFVTDADINSGPTLKRACAEHPGLYAFGGMWHGKRKLHRRSYGKILPLDGTEKVIGHVRDYSAADLAKLVD